jgi:hypothetical protein
MPNRNNYQTESMRTPLKLFLLNLRTHLDQFIIIVFASLPIVLAGCTTQKITDYQPASASVSERTAQESGVEVALDPFVESGRTKQYFDIDAVAEGIAILHVRVTNKTADQTFLVEKTDFHLLLHGDAEDLTATNKIERPLGYFSGGGVGPLTFKAFLIGGPGAESFSGPSLGNLANNSKFTEIQRNFTAKEMADATLSPGKSMEGFIYLAPLKKGEDWSRAATIKVNLTETKTRQLINLNIPLSH